MVGLAFGVRACGLAAFDRLFSTCTIDAVGRVSAKRRNPTVWRSNCRVTPTA